jgi:hypothetical protein
MTCIIDGPAMHYASKHPLEYPCGTRPPERRDLRESLLVCTCWGYHTLGIRIQAFVLVTATRVLAELQKDWTYMFRLTYLRAFIGDVSHSFAA